MTSSYHPRELFHFVNHTAEEVDSDLSDVVSIDLLEDDTTGVSPNSETDQSKSKRTYSQAFYKSATGHSVAVPLLSDDGLTRKKLTRGKQKIPIEFIQDRTRRYSTFSKRKTGLMKKASELAQLTGAEVLLLIASETNHVYTFATRRLKNIVTLDSGKELIKTCLIGKYLNPDELEKNSNIQSRGTPACGLTNCFSDATNVPSPCTHDTLIQNGALSDCTYPSSVDAPDAIQQLVETDVPATASDPVHGPFDLSNRLTSSQLADSQDNNKLKLMSSSHTKGQEAESNTCNSGPDPDSLPSIATETAQVPTAIGTDSLLRTAFLLEKTEIQNHLDPIQIVLVSGLNNSLPNPTTQINSTVLNSECAMTQPASMTIIQANFPNSKRTPTSEATDQERQCNPPQIRTIGTGPVSPALIPPLPRRTLLPKKSR